MQPKPKARTTKRPPREDMSQTAYRIMQKTVRRSESQRHAIPNQGFALGSCPHKKSM